MRTVFVGDVHGCAAELEELLERVGFAPGSDRLLLTGDAFSRGPDPERVWALLRATRAEMVLGNHDDRLRRQLRTAASGEEVSFGRPHHDDTFRRLRPLADELLPWLESLPLCIQGHPRHEPTSSGHLGRQAAVPHKDEAIQMDGFTLVHAGINPVAGLQATGREEFLSIRTWPPTGTLQGPRWHRAMEPGSTAIVFGHDAPGGLIVECRPGCSWPWLVGLDSGCIYGGQLSAWVLEETRLVQVASRQPAK